MYSKLPTTTPLDAVAEHPTEPVSWLAVLLRWLGLAAPPDEYHDWRAVVQDTWWYQLSCFAYCAAGGLLLLRPEPLERHMALFPWRCMGLSVFANGFVSYMADVETWGRVSVWRTIDHFLATTNSVLQIVIVVAAAMGAAETPFPLESVGTLGASVLVALACKHRASAAMRRGHCEGYLRWHAAWHYTLPTGAVAAQAVLHRACDYQRGGCACAAS
jgi:hypothetical protein